MLEEAERVFLGARRTVSWDRILLGNINVEHTECLKSWLLSNIAAWGGGACGDERSRRSS